MKFYQEMTAGQRRDFRRVIGVCAGGVAAVLLLSCVILPRLF